MVVSIITKNKLKRMQNGMSKFCVIMLMVQITDKIRVQMDAFLEDGSHEAIVTVIRTLAIAVPLMSSNLKDYILFKAFFCFSFCYVFAICC
jgi:hypothetical protein